VADYFIGKVGFTLPEL